MNSVKGQMSSVLDAIKDFIRPWVPSWAWARMRAHAKPLNPYQTDRLTFFPVAQDPTMSYTTGGDAWKWLLHGPCTRWGPILSWRFTGKLTIRSPLIDEHYGCDSGVESED
jgi:hypothetical protein